MLRAELYKYFKNHLFSITLILPIILVVGIIYLAPTLNNSNTFDNGLLKYIVFRNFFYIIMVPLYIMIICRIVGEMEQKNNNWILLMSMPLKKNKIYFIKMFTLTGMVSVHYLGYLIGILLVKVISSNFQIAFQSILLDLLLSFLCTFSIISFFYIFSLEKILLIVYLGIGIVMVLSGFLASQSEHQWVYCPLSYPFVVPSLSTGVPKFIFINVALTIVFHLIGFIRFRKREWV
ncbi:ABC transporter permease [Clostridium estertheticum]|uniref:ABC transporter permease n=1 Tax=Clostridium estertheticum TaxID=238834 RepID=UPI001CF2B572|nr:ABC transporter permease [Clostridium estertheticum]MCB2356532.1 ABC transporter permease [Clostridium estertheticum]WAG43617.1 ABC transporter permease [Clostridium estertheticum]